MRRNRNLLLIVYLVALLCLVGATVFGQTPKEYLKEFQQDAKIYHRSLNSITPEFVETTSNLYIDIDGERTQVEGYTIYPNKIHLSTSSYMYKYNLKVLIYHELGHYYLHRGHKIGTSSIYPASIMDISWDNCSWENLSDMHKQAYIQELFSY